MTGLATGPHLHYEFFVRGKNVDPMKVDLPLTEELKAEELPAFYALRDAMMAKLDAIADQELNRGGAENAED
jgi:murein DD-endopeptidase MepM/ murein hydrolase activator NlpD